MADDLPHCLLIHVVKPLRRHAQALRRDDPVRLRQRSHLHDAFPGGPARALRHTADALAQLGDEVLRLD